MQTMKRLLVPFIIIALLVVSVLLAYHAGENKQCTEIKLYNDYKFTCDGRKIQGPTYKNEYVTHAWEFHSK